jgi:hypothetical protein
MLYVMANVVPMDGKAQIGFHNESRVGEARVHARQLAKANRLMWWIGLLFGKVESVSGTNKTRSKILKLRTQIYPATGLNHDGHKLNKVTEIKICVSKGFRTAEDMLFFGFFGGSQYESSKQTKRHTSIPHRNPKF